MYIYIQYYIILYLNKLYNIITLYYITLHHIILINTHYISYVIYHYTYIIIYSTS